MTLSRQDCGMDQWEGSMGEESVQKTQPDLVQN